MGPLFNVNRKVAAQAFAVTQFALSAFTLFNFLVTGGQQKNPKAFYAIQLVGAFALGIVQIMVFRRLNLIATLGTAFLTANVLFLAASNLTGLCRGFPNQI
jgi:hypothetical protein